MVIPGVSYASDELPEKAPFLDLSSKDMSTQNELRASMRMNGAQIHRNPLDADDIVKATTNQGCHV